MTEQLYLSYNAREQLHLQEEGLAKNIIWQCAGVTILEWVIDNTGKTMHLNGQLFESLKAMGLNKEGIQQQLESSVRHLTLTLTRQPLMAIPRALEDVGDFNV